MEQTKPQPQPQLPSFSIVVETENLSSADLDGLTRCLDSLAAQDLSPTQAKEVLIVESGDVPRTLIEQLCADYPWLTVRRIEAGIDYYQAKMKGMALTTAEVIVLCDSDCVYEPIWLRNILTPLANPEVQVVAGETTTSASDAYGLAIALTYIFPRFSNQSSLSQASHYFCNNVAFRRNFLLNHPIPSELPIYRGNCVIHAHSLTEQGYTIWKQPQSRATHAAPNGLSHFFWRFLLLGYDAIAVSRLARRPSAPVQPPIRPLQDLRDGVVIGLRKFKQVLQRLYPLLSEDPRRLIYLPLALPIGLASLLLFFVGLGLGYFRPASLLATYHKVEAGWERS